MEMINPLLTEDALSLTNKTAVKGPDTGNKVDDAKLKEACQGFEEIFINMMLKEMRKGIPRSGLFPDSLQKDIYTGMFDQQIAREISTGKGIGIAEMLYERLSGNLK